MELIDEGGARGGAGGGGPDGKRGFKMPLEEEEVELLFRLLLPMKVLKRWVMFALSSNLLYKKFTNQPAVFINCQSNCRNINLELELQNKL